MTTYTTLQNKEIVKQQERIQKWERHLKETILGMAKRCAHRWLGECAHTENSPPVRVCLRCGAAEEGFGVGYVVLRNSSRIHPMECGDLMRLRTLLITNQHKGPLLRLEIKKSDLFAQLLGIDPEPLKEKA